MRGTAFFACCLVAVWCLEATQAGELTTPAARPWVRTHDPAKAPSGPTLSLRAQPRYTSTDSDPAGQPTWLLPDDRAEKAHYRTRRLRILLYGDIGRHWAYLFKWRRDSGMDQFGFYDAYVTYSGWKFADITVGQFKTPTDRINSTSNTKVPLFERPRASKLLSPDRDVGIMLHDARRSGGKYAWYLGVFNGDGINRTDNFGTVMWIGRFEYRAGRRLNVGVSVADNNGTRRTLYQKFLKRNGDPYGWLDYYSRGVMDELTWAVDAHYEDEHWRVFAGYARKDFDAPGAALPHASDWYVVGGWKVHCRGPEGLEVVFGYEDFDPNSAVVDSLDCRFYTVGVNWRPHGPRGAAGWKDQLRVQYQWRDERGREVDNDSLVVQYEMAWTLK